MLSLFYDLALFVVGLCALPHLIWQRFRHGKYRKSLAARLGLKLPLAPKNKQVIWIHAVSVGETRAVSSLYKELRTKFPSASFFISSITETGHAEAMRTLPGAESYFFLPLDFSFLIKRCVRKLKPDLLLLVEGEFWYNLLKETKAQGGKILLVNGKLSERSFRRLLWLKTYAKKLFSLIDSFCLQSPRFEERFLKLGVPKEKIHVTGNLKLDEKISALSENEKRELRKTLGIHEDEQVIVVGSTHGSEEQEIFQILLPLWQKNPRLKLIFVPRHPERFAKVETELRAHGFPLMLFSRRAQKQGSERLILVDAMGLLSRLYQIADLAIVGGSFVSHVGGHNIFEPIQAGIPVLFGPHMHTQQDLVTLVLEHRCGQQVKLDALAPAVEKLLLHKLSLRENCPAMCEAVGGAVGKTICQITT